MPYITRMFMPRAAGDRPLLVPLNSKKLAFVSQFVEIPNDVVFTVEYSVRAAQMAVYQVLGIRSRSSPHSTTRQVAHGEASRSHQGLQVTEPRRRLVQRSWPLGRQVALRRLWAYHTPNRWLSPMPRRPERRTIDVHILERDEGGQHEVAGVELVFHRGSGWNDLDESPARRTFSGLELNDHRDGLILLDIPVGVDEHFDVSFLERTGIR